MCQLIIRIIMASVVNASRSRSRHTMTDDSTTKNTRLLDRELFYSYFILGFVIFGPANMWLPLVWLHHCRYCYFYSLGRHQHTLGVMWTIIFRVDTSSIKNYDIWVQYPHPVTVSHLTNNLCRFYCSRCNGAFCFYCSHRPLITNFLG